MNSDLIRRLTWWRAYEYGFCINSVLFLLNIGLRTLTLGLVGGYLPMATVCFVSNKLYLVQFAGVEQGLKKGMNDVKMKVALGRMELQAKM